MSRLYQQIWDIVYQIPFGKVATYGQVARLAGLGFNSRLVGYALHNLPVNSTVPWHRVINCQGKISLSKEDGSFQLQKKLLQQENIIFINEKIDLQIYRWIPDL